MKKMTVQEMYDYTKENNMPLLSNYSGDFWETYTSNYEIFDRLFCRMYKSWEYMEEPTGNTEAEKEANITDFIADVYSMLMMNDKKYGEMYRIETVDDDSYSMLDNYNMTETMDRETKQGSRTDNLTTTNGNRQDTTTTVHGNRNTTTTEQVSPYDSSTWNNQNKSETIDTAGNDTITDTKGQQIDTTQNVIGQQTDTEDYTLTRKGNIGVQTATEVMAKHNDFWKKYQFYQIIFSDILKNFLVMGGC